MYFILHQAAAAIHQISVMDLDSIRNVHKSKCVTFDFMAYRCLYHRKLLRVERTNEEINNVSASSL